MYEDLFDAIVKRCQKEGWFGPEFAGPEHVYGVPEQEPRRYGFQLPPVSDEQVQATIQALGFAPPAFLIALYSRLANGGFGPVGGLKGMCGGYGSLESGTRSGEIETMVDQYQWRSAKKKLPPEEYHVFFRESNAVLLPYGTWPIDLLPICDLGCVTEACVNSEERMFSVAASDNNEKYWLMQSPWSIEEWLWRWLRDETYYIG